jgi:tetratricopeptide (TPR) repeat protein
VILARRAAALLPVLALGAAVPLLGACPAALPPALREATVKPGDLPASVPELIAYAEEEHKKEQTSSSENIVIAVDRGLVKEPRNYELLWRGARACAWLTEEFTDNERRASYAQKGVDYARRAVEADAKRVEAHYYLGINLGQSARTKTVGAYMMVPKVVNAGKAAMGIDERFDYGGPPRLIGTVYAKAPPWPASIGDIDEGIQYLTRAVQIAPDYPQNHLFYGDALVTDKKLDEAEKEYKLVLEACNLPQWSLRAERWRRDANAGLKKIAEKRAE